jgi:hypothetical protein
MMSYGLQHRLNWLAVQASSPRGSVTGHRLGLGLCASLAALAATLVPLRAATTPAPLDSGLIAWQWCKHGYAGEDAYRENILAGLRARRANAIVYPLQDSRDGWNLWLGGNVVLGMYMLGTPSPVDGHRTDDWVKRCNSEGITTQIPVLFNVQDGFAGEFGRHDEYLRWFANSINWAPAGQFIICLGLFVDRNQKVSAAWTPAYLDQMAAKLKQLTGNRFKIAIHATYPECVTWGAGTNIDIMYMDPWSVVTTQASPAGAGTLTGGGTYPAGSLLQLAAQPSLGWLFVKWQDSVTNNPRSIIVPAGNTNFTATFAPATALALQANPPQGGNARGGGVCPVGYPVPIVAQPTMGWRFLNWSDGNSNRFRSVTLGAAGATLTAQFTPAPTYVLLQAGDGGVAGRWSVGSNYLPATWTPIAAAQSNGWVLRAQSQNRLLMQQGTGGAIALWDLTNGVPARSWPVSAALPGWIARDCDGNRVLLQAGDGGAVGLWTLSVSNAPATWSLIAGPVAGLVAKALRDERILVQAGTSSTLGYWLLNQANAVAAWVPLNANLPAGWGVRSMTRDYMLLQAGDGGAAGLWDLDANGQPVAWHELSAALPGWIMRSLDQAQAARLTVLASTNIGGTVTGGGLSYVGAQENLTAAPAAGWIFTAWNDGQTNTSRTVQVPVGGGAYTANFARIVALNVAANPPQGGAVSGGGSYASGSTAALSATAFNGWLFTTWNDGNTNASRTVIVPLNDLTYTANFGRSAVIGVAANTNAGGSVTGGGTWVVGSRQVLTATASNGWLFVGWADGPTNNPRAIIVAEGGADYTAIFAPATTLVLQANPAHAGSVTGGGLVPVGYPVAIAAQPNVGWRFLQWSDGETNRARTVTLGPAGASLTANFIPAPLYIMLQNGESAVAGLWTLGTNYQPATWTPLATPGAGWVLRAINQSRLLMQQGVGGAIRLVELTNGVPGRSWAVSGALPGWIARDLDGNRVLLQAGDGGQSGIWTLNASNVPIAWTGLAGASPNLITRDLCGSRVLVQFGSSAVAGYWTLDAGGRITAWTPLATALPEGWVLRAMSDSYLLLQLGEGGPTGLWDLDAQGQPIAWHLVSPALPGWSMRGMDQF